MPTPSGGVEYADSGPRILARRAIANAFLAGSGPVRERLPPTGRHHRNRTSHRPRPGANAVEKNVVATRFFRRSRGCGSRRFEVAIVHAKRRLARCIAAFAQAKKKPAEAGFFATRRRSANRCAQPQY